jgi:hypothetical protein
MKREHNQKQAVQKLLVEDTQTDWLLDKPTLIFGKYTKNQPHLNLNQHIDSCVCVCVSMCLHDCARVYVSSGILSFIEVRMLLTSQCIKQC